MGKPLLTLLLVAVVATAPATALSGPTVTAHSPSESGAQPAQQEGTASCDYATLYDQTIDSVVQIQTAQGSGSGFVINLGATVEVDGDVTANGNVTVSADTEVDGNIRANGTVVLGEDVEVDGDVTGATVQVADSAEVDGEVTETDS